MPRISQFHGVSIYMYYKDHAPPHFHAIHGDHEATIAIDTGAVIEGKLPRRSKGLVTDWAMLRRAELRRNWDLARAELPLEPIPPLS